MMQIRRKGSAVNCVGQEYTGVYTIVHRCRAQAGRVRAGKFIVTVGAVHDGSKIYRFVTRGDLTSEFGG